MHKTSSIFLSIVFAVCCAASLSGAPSVSSDIHADIVPNDTLTALKLQSLQTKVDKLQKEIGEQDKKRNATYHGVLPETQERMNDRQDSICLDLRSQQTEVQLQIDEAKKANLLNALINSKK